MGINVFLICLHEHFYIRFLISSYLWQIFSIVIDFYFLFYRNVYFQQVNRYNFFFWVVSICF